MKLFLTKQLSIAFILTFFFFYSSAQDYIMDGSPIVGCSGRFLDSGDSEENYGVNENFTTTICSDQSNGTHIQLQFSELDIGAGDVFHVYDANAADPGFLLSFDYNPPLIIQATAVNSSGCLTIVFSSDAIDDGNSGWQADIRCTQACQPILAQLATSTPAVVPVDTGWIDICLGDLVSFEGTGSYPQNGIIYNHSDLTSIFEWDFGDGHTAFGSNASHEYETPGGYIVQLKITDQFGCNNINYLSQRIRIPSPPSFVVDESLVDVICTRDTLSISYNTDPATEPDLLIASNESSFSQNSCIKDTLLLPDGTGISYESSIQLSGFPLGSTLTSIDDLASIDLSIEHSYAGDLSINIICPNDSSTFLLDYPSGIGQINFGEPYTDADNITHFCIGNPYTYNFVNSASNGNLLEYSVNAPTYAHNIDSCMVTGDAPTTSDTYFPAGEYEPEHSFSNLIGCPLNGDWTLSIEDHVAQDNGSVSSWCINFADYLTTETETFTPEIENWGWEEEPSIVFSDSSLLITSPNNPGTAAYSFWTVDNFGCLADTSLQFNVLPNTHPDCFDCNIQVNEQTPIVLCEEDTTTINLQAAIALEECIVFEHFPQDQIGASNHPPSNPYKNTIAVNNLSLETIEDPFSEICSICLNLSTNFLSDIKISIEAPNGVIIPLSIANGQGSNLGYVNTCFSPLSTENITAANPPYTGEFQPEGMLWSSLIGSPINGEWSLIITDDFGILDFGELTQWSISFYETNAYQYSWTPSVGLSCDNCDSPSVFASETTNYSVAIQDIYGCSLDTSILVEVLPNTHPDCLTSASEVISKTNFAISPNPVLTILQLEIPDIHHQFNQIEVFNALGKKVKANPIKDGQFLINLDVSSLSSGVYYLLLKGNNEVSSLQKIIKL